MSPEKQGMAGGRYIKCSLFLMFLYSLFQDGSFEVQVPTLGPIDRTAGEAGAGSSGTIASPMPGTIEKVNVKEGDVVKKGQPLGTLVAMKMEHIIKSPCDGIVEKVHHQVGKTVAKGSGLFTVK